MEDQLVEQWPRGFDLQCGQRLFLSPCWSISFLGLSLRMYHLGYLIYKPYQLTTIKPLHKVKIVSRTDTLRPNHHTHAWLNVIRFGTKEGYAVGLNRGTLLPKDCNKIDSSLVLSQ